MDKNQAIALLLFLLLMMVYFIYFVPDLPKQPSPPIQKPTQDSLSVNVEKIEDSPISSISEDTALQYGFFNQAFKGEAKEIILENKDIQITFNTKGGKIEKVLLKNYITNQKASLILLNKQSSIIKENIQTIYGTLDINQLYYRAYQPDEYTLILSIGNGKISLSKTYRLSQEGGFLLSYNLDFKNLDNVVNRKSVEFSWTNQVRKLEKSLIQSRNQSAINYYTENEEFDYVNGLSANKTIEKIPQPIKWLSFKQKFFNVAVITQNHFENVLLSAYTNEADTNIVTTLSATFYTPIITTDKTNKLTFYFGPNDYDICGDVGEEIAKDFEKNVYLGWIIFAPINRIAIIPLFQFLEKYISNYGIIILIMVFIIKMLLFPLTYKSYISMAKMKVLKPEIEAIKKKHGNDMQTVQRENMKLYSQFGVNPLSGCIPVLVQTPVWIAMFNFFPNAIQLRQKPFLWAEDLSSYDSIFDLPFEIPFYGEHVSLFTLLMTVSTIIYTYYNNQMGATATAAQGPMKTMMYIMPITIMFFLNDYSSGLTYYYFISNIITIVQQLITKRLINEGKIRRKLEENKKSYTEGKSSGSKFMRHLSNAMKAQEEIKKDQTLKKRTNNSVSKKKTKRKR